MTATLAVTPDYVIGDTWDLTATIRNELGTGPFNLTGCTVLFTLKRKSDVAANDNAALVKLSWVSGGAATGIAVATPTSGVAAITVPSSVTAAMSSAHRYRYDVKVINAAGEPKDVVIVEFTPADPVTYRTVP
jgi:hypothetical protein